MSVTSGVLGMFGMLSNVFLYGWWLFLIVGIYAMKKRMERWPMDVVIYEKKGDNLIKTNDRLGKRFDKVTGVTYSQLLKAKDTIPMLNYDCILHCSNKHTNFLEKIVNILRPTAGTIFLFRYGSKQYKPIKTNIKGDSKLKLTEIKDAEGNPVFQYMYNQFDPRVSIGQLEFEVVDWDNMNFMVQEQRASVIRRARKGEFWAKTLIPMVIIGACVVIAIFILKFSADVGTDLRSGAGQPAPQQQQGSSKLMGGVTDAFAPGS